MSSKLRENKMAKRKSRDIQKSEKKKEKIERLWKQAKQSLSKLSQESIKLAKRGEKEIVRATKIGRIHLEILNLKRKKDSLYQQIGEKVVELQRENKIDAPGLKIFCSKVDSLEGQIRTKKAAASKIKKSKSR